MQCCPCGCKCVVCEQKPSLASVVAPTIDGDVFCCDCACFPSTATVNLDNGESVAMSELQVGARVQIGMKSVSMSELQVGARVQTGMKSVAMSELQVGDKVQTGMKSVAICELQVKE